MSCPSFSSTAVRALSNISCDMADTIGGLSRYTFNSKTPNNPKSQGVISGDLGRYACGTDWLITRLCFTGAVKCSGVPSWCSACHVIVLDKMLSYDNINKNINKGNYKCGRVKTNSRQRLEVRIW
ncbi:hypothetical protein AVEN_96485-1 [Araneus ventricosus]|uniref:Uncharacterized protein n=1 Tax=Araneus ventricosus TaxID=182803 RepID=A0A4Y2CVA5_ARAVE|nr:hypothetical protein AVEN_96485-1 [Araneus ventricosus]